MCLDLGSTLACTPTDEIVNSVIRGRLLDDESCASLESSNVSFDALLEDIENRWGRKSVILIDNYDDIFLKTNEDGTLSNSAVKWLDLLQQMCEMHAAKKRVGTILMFGTYRVSDLNILEECLSGMVDLSFDITHNDTFGKLINEEDVIKYNGEENSEYSNYASISAQDYRKVQSQRFIWNDETQKPIPANKVSVTTSNNEAEKSMEYIRGYWWGGVNSRGNFQIMQPYSTYNPDYSQFLNICVSQNNHTCMEIVRLLVKCLTTYSPLEKLSMSRLIIGNKKTRGENWPALFIQSGLFTLDDRVMRFDEFHTYAFYRLRFSSVDIHTRSCFYHAFVEMAARNSMLRKNKQFSLSEAQSKISRLHEASGCSHNLCFELNNAAKTLQQLLAPTLSVDDRTEFMKLLLMCLPYARSVRTWKPTLEILNSNDALNVVQSSDDEHIPRMKMVSPYVTDTSTSSEWGTCSKIDSCDSQCKLLLKLEDGKILQLMQISDEELKWVQS